MRIAPVKLTIPGKTRLQKAHNVWVDWFNKRSSELWKPEKPYNPGFRIYKSKNKASKPILRTFWKK